MNGVTKLIKPIPAPKTPIEEALTKIRLRILRVLHEEPDNELNVSALGRKTKLNSQTLRYHLKTLLKEDLVREKAFGRVRIYQLKKTPRVKLLCQLFDGW